MSVPTLLIEAYQSMSDRERVAQARGLQESLDSSEAFLLGALRTEVNSLARWHIIKGLGRCRSIEAVPLILQACREPDIDFGETSLHAICAWSLGKIGTESFGSVVTLFDETDSASRQCAADALGEMRDSRGIPRLCFALEHDEYRVKLVSGLSLSKIGEEALPALEELIERVQIPTRIIAIDAIAKIDTNQSLAILGKILRQGSVEDKKLVLKVRQRWDVEASGVLETMINESDIDLSNLARRALAKLKVQLN